jgi:uncharacterized protein YqjF (DUF2071 family)
MANYVVDPALLQAYLPCRMEIDTFNNEHYISLVGFLFEDVKLKGIAFPFHTNFEEVNLRFYVRYKESNNWKRGVVFIKEIVPRRMITFIANTMYSENYATHTMKHTYTETPDELNVSYEWKVDKDWNHLNCVAEKTPKPIVTGSGEEFITEHYWGYTFINQMCTGAYQVIHPKWKVHTIKTYDIRCSIKQLYGETFVEALNQQPRSLFLAEGSSVKVMTGTKIFDQQKRSDGH